MLVIFYNGALVFVSDHLEREKRILEERARKRVELLSDLARKAVNTHEKVTVIPKQKLH